MWIWCLLINQTLLQNGSNSWHFLHLKQSLDLFVIFAKALSSWSCCSQVFYTTAFLFEEISNKKSVTEPFYTTKDFMTYVFLRSWNFQESWTPTSETRKRLVTRADWVNNESRSVETLWFKFFSGTTQR